MVGRIGWTKANNTRDKTTCPPYYLSLSAVAWMVGRIGWTKANNTRDKTTCPPYYQLSIITYHLSLITYHLSLTTYHLPLTTYHLSLITYYLLLITYYLLLITYYFPLCLPPFFPFSGTHLFFGVAPPIWLVNIDRNGEVKFTALVKSR